MAASCALQFCSLRVLDRSSWRKRKAFKTGHLFRLIYHRCYLEKGTLGARRVTPTLNILASKGCLRSIWCQSTLNNIPPGCFSRRSSSQSSRNLGLRRHENDESWMAREVLFLILNLGNGVYSCTIKLERLGGLLGWWFSPRVCFPCALEECLVVSTFCFPQLALPCISCRRGISSRSS